MVGYLIVLIPDRFLLPYIVKRIWKACQATWQTLHLSLSLYLLNELSCKILYLYPNEKTTTKQHEQQNTCTCKYV